MKDLTDNLVGGNIHLIIRGLTEPINVTSESALFASRYEAVYNNNCAVWQLPGFMQSFILDASLRGRQVITTQVGSIAALVLIVTFLFFAFGFRIRRARRRSDTGIAGHKNDQRAAAVDPASQNGKAELEDAEYTKRLKRLHEGARPELEGSRHRKTGWRAFSIMSLTRGPRPVVAELDAGTVIPGPHELPA